MNMSDLMKQAQQFQENLKKMQDEMAGKTVEGSAGGGMVTAIFNGNSELVTLSIEPQLLSEQDVTLVQDLISAAINDGIRKSKELGKSEMSKLTGGLNLPGMF
ncbi:YbaB/EbfC family nucleoid-associated protein [Desulfogranum japonicum]|uniref:YbaB/EbfC family nucleoid-associated protein n=1 Tax=Desulfogranum japonicum TaxID=231447 RepID=UPI000418759D|nr:YbaB/EbfC family nucleoid-associated protein [Desulfogranum japonicum]